MSNKKPVTVDFADEAVVQTLFNEAFQHPRRTYVVQPVNTEVARMWLCENTHMANFVWCAGVKSFKQRLDEGGALHVNQLIHLDTLYYRDRCGWVGMGCTQQTEESVAVEGECGADHHCGYPDTKDAETCEHGTRLCFNNNCPIASAAYPQDIRTRDPDLYRSDYRKDKWDEDEPTDWMLVYSRPRYAYVPNITVLGCEDVYEKGGL